MISQPAVAHHPQCPVCRNPKSNCFCERCRECGAEGNPSCYIQHSLKVSDADLQGLIADTLERCAMVETDALRALLELQARRAADRKP